MNHRIKLEHIQAAMNVIDPVFLNTPQFVNEPLSSILGCRLLTKIETLNPIRSFKGRGAEYFLSTLETLNPRPKIVCASAGNFGQAMAFAARKRGFELTVYASVNANPLKIERMRDLGGHVILAGEDFDAAKQIAKQFALEHSALMVEDSLQEAITEGSGTMGLELLQSSEAFEMVLVPLGNGAMINGIATWVKAHKPETRVIGVSAKGADAMEQSWRSNKIVTLEKIDTIADGIGVRLPIPEALEDMKGLVDDVLLVDDSTILQAMKLLHQHLGIVVEPSGAVGVAAILEQPEKFKGSSVATIVCGGNLTDQQMKLWL
jgi:threonine dehydratase